jgi:hypothetical protein
LISIDSRRVAPAVIEAIEKLDAASVSGTFDESMRSLINAALTEVENLNASDEDKFVLRRKLRSFLRG